MTYNKKIIVLQKQDVTDEIGNSDAVWFTIYKGWASVNCIGGNMYYEAAQTNSQNDMIFKTRFCKALSVVKYNENDPTYRIEYNGKMFEITHVDDFMERHLELVFRAKEVRG